MIKKIKCILGISDAKEPATDFSKFFHSASSADKKKVLEGVVREANKDQRDLIEKYNLRKPVTR